MPSFLLIIRLEGVCFFIRSEYVPELLPKEFLLDPIVFDFWSRIIFNNWRVSCMPLFREKIRKMNCWNFRSKWEMPIFEHRDEFSSFYQGVLSGLFGKLKHTGRWQIAVSSIQFWRVWVGWSYCLKIHSISLLHHLRTRKFDLVSNE